MSDYPLHDRALKYAAHCLGVHETPAHSNRGPIQVTNPVGGVDYFQDHDFLNGRGYPWCADFALTCWAEGAKHALPYKSAGAYDLYNWAVRAGWARSVHSCVPGDIVCFNLGSGHIGVLEHLSTGTVDTIDGNHSDRVQRASRPYSSVRGGIHIPEDPHVVIPPAPEPYWVIATSVNGKRVLVFSKFATEKTILGLLPRLFAKYGKAGITITRGGVRK